MSPKKLKLNKILTTFFVIILLVSFPIKGANAGIFSWFLSSANSTNAIYSSSAAYVSIDFMGQHQDEENANQISIVQSTSLVQNSSPLNGLSLIMPNPNFKELTVIASAYSSTPDQTDDSPFITAWGTSVRDGVIAANFLPFGTKIKIPEIYGNKTFVVEDRMNSRYWKKIDVWFPDRKSALEFGLKNLKIQIVES